eukprot:8227712-Heterocapsa_arctica.AAC.1
MAGLARSPPNGGHLLGGSCLILRVVSATVDIPTSKSLEGLPLQLRFGRGSFLVLSRRELLTHSDTRRSNTENP